MAKLYITEFTGAKNGGTIPVTPPLAEQAVTFTGTAAQSAAFNAKTTLVRIQPDAICSVAFGSNPTATANNQRMTAGQTEYFTVVPGQKVSAITNS